VAAARLGGAGTDRCAGGADRRDACEWCSSSSRKERDVIAEVGAGMRGMARVSMGFTRGADGGAVLASGGLQMLLWSRGQQQQEQDRKASSCLSLWWS